MAIGEKSTSLEKKGHVCPPSNATHPRDRWETAFVYAFITRFTTMKPKIEGFINITDLEEALMSQHAHPILVQVLSRFVLILKPQTRNLSAEQLPSTLSSILQEHMKSTERSVFWDDDLKANVEPIQAMQGNLWDASWDMKLRILRQLVEIQLTHHSETKEMVDRAWGVSSAKHRKKEALVAPPDPEDPHSMVNLQTVPLGQDSKRKRYWSFDDSPRLYVSTNPWKVTSEFHAIAETKDEYLSAIQKLKEEALPATQKKLSRSEKAHLSLIDILERRLEAIDAELARASRIRKKIEQKELYKIQAEMRTTRTRRSTRRPDYVYSHQNYSDDDGDEYRYQEDNDDDFDQNDYDDDEFGVSRMNGRAAGRRRSSRTSVLNANGKRPSDASDWRIERRSTRLVAATDVASDYSNKRARTEERSVSSAPSDSFPAGSSSSHVNGLKKSGAAAVKPSEVVVEQVAGKKKSKFWYYAVEPVSGLLAQPADVATDHPNELVNGHANGDTNGISLENESSKLNGINAAASDESVLHAPLHSGD